MPTTKLENNVKNTIKLSVILYIFTALSALAASNNSSVTIDKGSDEQGNKNSAVSVKLSLDDTKQLIFGLGKNEVLSGTESINNNFMYAGLFKKTSDEFKIGGMLEYSGLKNQFTMVTTSIPVRFSKTNYYFEVIPALRNINITTLLNRTITVASTALGFKTGIYLGDYFRLGGSAYSYNYARDVSLLATFQSTRYFNERTLMLSSGLLKKSYNVEGGLDFNSFSVSLGSNRSISAIDDTRSDYTYTILDYYLSDSWTLSALFGQYLNTPADQNNYSSLSVSYAF